MAPKQQHLIEAPITPKTTKGQFRIDGWVNALSGMGTNRDKRTYQNYRPDAIMTKEEAALLYAGDGIAARIVDALPDDMIRAWGSFVEDEIDEFPEGFLTHQLGLLKAPKTIGDAKRWADLMGGSLLYVGITGSGSPQTALKIKPESTIEFLRVYDLGDIRTSECVWEEDTRSPNYGNIKMYKVVTRIGMTWREYDIHYTRCRPFYGTQLPRSQTWTAGTLEARYWGIPKYQQLIRDFKDFRGVFANAAAILNEFIIGKYKFSDLDEMLSEGNEPKLKARMAAIEMSKSLINAVLLGSEEDYSRDSATVTGIPDLLDRFMMIISAVSKVPVTKLFGRSAAGMNATGENELKNWYDEVAVEMSESNPDMQWLGDLVADINGKKRRTWKWNELFQLNEQQRAEVKRIEAEVTRTLADADQRNIDSGVYGPDQVYEHRYEKDWGKRIEPPAPKADNVNAMGPEKPNRTQGPKSRGL